MLNRYMGCRILTDYGYSNEKLFYFSPSILPPVSTTSLLLVDEQSGGGLAMMISG